MVEKEVSQNTSFKLIVFDLGRVLVGFDQDLIARRLIKRSKRSLEEIVAYYRKSNIFDSFERGRISPQEALESINKMFNLRLSMEEFNELWSDIFFENPGMEEIVVALKAHYRLFILSDTNVLHYEHIVKHFPIVNYFEEHLVSFKLGTRKPDPRTFEAALKRANVSGRETIFIDDKERNVEGAHALGITGIHYRSVKETREAFERLGVLP